MNNSNNQLTASDILELTHDAIILREMHGHITLWNRGAEETYGWAREEALGKNIEVLLKRRYTRSHDEIMAELLENDRWEGEIEDTKRDATLIVVSSRWALRRDETGHPIGVLETGNDITAHRKAEEERARLASAVQAVKEGVSIVSADGKIEYANPTFCEMVGYSCHEIEGKSFELLREAPGAESFYHAFADTMRSGTSSFGRIKGVAKDKTVFDADVTISPFGEGKRLGYAVITRDVTREIKLEEQVERAQRMEALAMLAAGVAHDFKNILTGVTGFIQLASDKAPADSGIKRYHEQALKAAAQGMDLVKEILAFARTDGQERTTIHLASVLGDSIQLFRSALSPAISLTFNVTASRDKVLADATQMRQVLINLVTNAAQAIGNDRKGSIQITLEDAAVAPDAHISYPELRPGDYLVVSVHDNGPGMEREIAEHIFEPFFTTKERGEGTGLGLSVVHGIVRNHGGAVTVESEPGKGSVFRVFLPKAKEEEARGRGN